MMVPKNLDGPLKKWFYGPKMAFFAPKRVILSDLRQNLALAPALMLTVHCCQHKKVYFWCPVMMVPKKLIGAPKKLDFCPKNGIVDPKKGHFG